MPRKHKPMWFFHQQCSACGEWKHVSQYSLNNARWNKINTACTPCRKLQLGRSNAKTARAYHLRKNYDLTPARVDAMKAAQNHLCRSCSRHLPLVVDHDHITGRVRGLLCNSCNRGIGYLGDSIDRILAAATYLRETTDALSI